jgi:hypothetical protein
MVFMIPFLLKAQIYLGDNGLTVTGTGVNKKVQLGGSLLLNTSFDLGASFTYNIKKGTANYLHILNNGNIGFGTNAPTAAFDVLGASRFRSTLTMNSGTANRTTQLTNSGFYISRTTDGTYTNSITGDVSMAFNTRGNYSFISNAIERVTFLESGNVGIGNTNPLYKLDVNGTFRGRDLVSQVPVGNATSLKLLNQDGTMLGSFESDAGASTFLKSYYNLTIDPNTSGAAGSYLKITTFSGTGTRMVVADHNGVLSTQAISGGGGIWSVNGANVNSTNTGNIGIGVTTPAFKLDVNGNVRIGSDGLYGNNGVYSAPLLKFTANNQVNLDPQGFGTISGQIKANGFLYSNNYLMTEMGVVSKASTTSINTPFNIYGISRPDAPVNFLPYAGLGGIFDKSVWSSGLGLSFFTSFGPDISGGAYTSEKMRLSSNGSLLVGQNIDAGYKLDINGTARATTRMSVGTFTQGNGISNVDKIITDGVVRADGGFNMRNVTVNDNAFVGLKSNAYEVQIVSVIPMAFFNFIGGGTNGSMFRIGDYGFNATSGSGNVNAFLIDNPIQPVGTNNINYNYVNVGPEINQASLGSGIVRGFYYNPTVTNIHTSPHFAFESTSGKIKASDLAGTGTRMVVADANGVLSTQAISGGGGIWSVNGANVNSTNTGNIGIGVTTPASKLDVNGNVRIGNSSFSGYIELEQVNNNQSRIWGGPQESIVFGPDNGIRVKTNVFGVQAGTMAIDGNISLVAGNTVISDMMPGVQRNSTLKVVGNYTNSGAGGSWEGNGYVGAVDVATSIAPTTVTLNQFSVSSKINTTAGTTIHRGFYYNPVLTGTTGLTNIAFEATSGQVKIGGLSGTGSRMVVADANGVLGVQSIPVSGGGSGNWNTIGNNIVNANAGFVSIGTSANPAPTDPQLKLAVNGNIYAQKLKITQQGWADYVFEPTYKLMPLSELEEYIYKNKHLPDVPSAVEVETKGLDLGDNQTILLKKIEELTLYVIELKKEIETIKFKDKAKGNKK